MKSVNIDALSEEELVELNHKIVARLRFLSQMRSHSEMLDFRIGEKVKFHPSGRPELIGTLTRYNKKTVTVITEAGQHWNVAPGLLSKLDSHLEGNAAVPNATVVQFSGRERKKIEANSKKDGEINSPLQADILFANYAEGLAARVLRPPVAPSGGV